MALPLERCALKHLSWPTRPHFHHNLALSLRSIRFSTAHSLSLDSKRVSTRPHAALNPPASTRPPTLELPSRDRNQSIFKHYYRLGKSYVTFYKTGIKAIYQNYKLARQIQHEIPSGLSKEAALAHGSISRASYQLLLRTRRDLSRLPLFALVLIICGEFTPLVVVFLGLSGVVPRTCWIPKQIQGAQKKIEERRRRSFREGTLMKKEQRVDGKRIEELPKPALLHIGRTLGLYSEWWDKAGLRPPFLASSIRKKVAQLEVDDGAIRRGGGVALLDGEEMRLAAADRGLDILEKPEKELREHLRRWMAAREKRSVQYLLLTRPAAWQNT